VHWSNDIDVNVNGGADGNTTMIHNNHMNDNDINVKVMVELMSISELMMLREIMNKMTK
jgi:hypothetical protein